MDTTEPTWLPDASSVNEVVESTTSAGASLTPVMDSEIVSLSDNDGD